MKGYHEHSIIEQAVIRLIITIAIYCSTINTDLKMTLILALDFVKNGYFYIRDRQQLGNLAKNSVYQDWDKTVDTFTYFLVFRLAQQVKWLSKGELDLLFVALFVRSIGVCLMFKNRDYLAYFPDLFKEILFVLYLRNVNKISDVSTIVVSVIFILFKIYSEYNLHINKKSLSNLFDV